MNGPWLPDQARIGDRRPRRRYQEAQFDGYCRAKDLILAYMNARAAGDSDGLIVR